MTTHDKKSDGIDTLIADQHDLESYRQAEEALSRLRAPILLHADNSHERLYIAALDGTGQDLDNPKLGPPTNVGTLAIVGESRTRGECNA